MAKFPNITPPTFPNDTPTTYQHDEYFFDVDGVLVDLISPICRLHRLHAPTMSRQAGGLGNCPNILAWHHNAWEAWDQWEAWGWETFEPPGITVADIYNEHTPLPYDCKDLATLNQLCEASMKNELDGSKVWLLTHCSTSEARQAKKDYFIRKGFHGLSKAL